MNWQIILNKLKWIKERETAIIFAIYKGYNVEAEMSIGEPALKFKNK